MKKYRVIIIALLIGITGCERSVYRLLYNSMDTYIYRAITWYIDPDPDQERFLREKIGAHFQWHRRSELIKYAATLQGLRDRMARGLRQEDVAWAQARVRRHEIDFLGAIADDVAAFLSSLDRKQIDRLDRRMGERIAEFEEKASASEDERVREETKSTVRLAEFLYGGLTGPQSEEIARIMRGLENIEPLRMRLFRERRDEFIALLRSGPDRKRITAYLRRLAADPDKSIPEYFRLPSERRDRRLTGEFLRFDRDLVTPVQRKHAVERIDLLIQTIRELASE